ncbi:MAG TPA: carbamoyltransferase HypF [Thermoanaerobaculia bacterium]|nr:carbamoyltransferase HypF [Thermoanaerobaculia bacterium]
MTARGRRIEVRGTVQGVGFRPFVYQLARRIGVNGRVRNDSRGVVIDAFGAAGSLDDFIEALEAEAPPAARVRSIDWSAIPFETASGFTIVESASSTEHRVSIPADLATCGDCLREILDPTNRRYRYAFTNCTNCGPRYSIVNGAPYDRARTSMARFVMCPDCQREYDDPLDRRFHAQPNACPVCGPRLVAVTPQRHEIGTSDPIEFAARALRAGFIVALKGLGGFQLACDAMSPGAVQRLRERKRREAKPLAVMVRDLADADRLALLTNEERALLTSVERPIVLARKREVDDDNPLIGLFLPYTPLHHILLRDAGTPLVMTSGNVSDEPMVTRSSEAFERLRNIADVFLVHDREIVTRVDDSVARVIGGSPALLRRARGYVPRAIESGREFAEPVLACGAHLKNTFCIATGSNAYLGPHIGDLETLETLRAYESAIERMKEFVGASPSIVAHDMHPDYFSTRYALAQANARTIAVQHHHAHIVSAMAEHRLDGPVVGVAYDGTGYGTDGTAWGGEILIARYADFERFATFHPIPLAGGDQAVRQPWRVALALLDESFDGEAPLHALPLFRTIERAAIDAVRRMIERNFNSPLARGVGRYFDAFGALFLGMREMRYEGEVAFRWNGIADELESGRYPILIHDGVAPWEIDPRPTLRAAVDDFMRGVAPAVISARFHNTIAEATIEVARAALQSRGEMPVVLSGGCFQNARLAESVLRGFHKVYMNREVPPGDGGIALGQAFVANAVVRSRSSVVSEELVCV